MLLFGNLIVPAFIVNFIKVNTHVTISKGWMCLDEVRMSLVSKDTVRHGLFFGGLWKLSTWRMVRWELSLKGKETRKAGQVGREEGRSYAEI